MNKKVLCCAIAASLMASLASYSATGVLSGSDNVVFAADSTVKEYGRLSYVENSDGTLTITGCADDVVWVSIDGTINGKQITAIAKNAFAGCKSLRYVYIGENIQQIGSNAFADTGITKITIPASVHTIYSRAFSGCKNLTTVCIYSKHYMNVFFGEDIFKDCSKDLTVYCATGSGTALYAKDAGLKLRQSDYYWVDHASEEVSETQDDTESDEELILPDDTDSSSELVPDSSSGNSSGSSSGIATGGCGPDEDIPQDSDSSLGGRYDDMPDLTKSTYEDNESVVSPQYGTKIIKDAPPGADTFEYKYTYDGDGYIFEKTGIFVSEKDYIILCNCVAQEYGASYVPEWEMALVAEVIFNRYERYGYDSLYESIVAPNAFEHSDRYSDLDTFSPLVNDRVINAVNIYLSYPEYFQEGYMSFRGDDTWNYFW